MKRFKINIEQILYCNEKSNCKDARPCVSVNRTETGEIACSRLKKMNIELT